MALDLCIDEKDEERESDTHQFRNYILMNSEFSRTFKQIRLFLVKNKIVKMEGSSTVIKKGLCFPRHLKPFFMLTCSITVAGDVAEASRVEQDTEARSSTNKESTGIIHGLIWVNCNIKEGERVTLINIRKKMQIDNVYKAMCVIILVCSMWFLGFNF